MEMGGKLVRWMLMMGCRKGGKVWFQRRGLWVGYGQSQRDWWLMTLLLLVKGPCVLARGEVAMKAVIRLLSSVGSRSMDPLGLALVSIMYK